MLINFVEAMRLATNRALEEDKDVIVIGEGVPDPKAVFGTTRDLSRPSRVFDMPISENGGTGICIGAAVTGLKPILVHQRIDFSLYAMDQVVNNAAKWSSMYGGRAGTCPLVIRMIVGRGWGQGNQHSQNLSGLYASIPGLKVVAPSSASSAHALFLAAVQDKNPVIFIEHRWLHNTESDFDVNQMPAEIGKAKVIPGRDLTIVSWSYQTVEALKLKKQLWELNIDAEIVDLQTIRPIDWNTIFQSLDKTQRLVVLDESWKTNGLAGEIMAKTYEMRRGIYDMIRITLPDCYCPSTPHLAKDFYPKQSEMLEEILDLFHTVVGRKTAVNKLKDWEKSNHLDVPDKQFRGPF